LIGLPEAKGRAEGRAGMGQGLTDLSQCGTSEGFDIEDPGWYPWFCSSFGPLPRCP